MRADVGCVLCVRAFTVLCQRLPFDLEQETEVEERWCVLALRVFRRAPVFQLVHERVAVVASQSLAGIRTLIHRFNAPGVGREFLPPQFIGIKVSCGVWKVEHFDAVWWI